MDIPNPTYDGVDLGRLAIDAGVPRIDAYATVSSTLDLAHAAAAAGAPAGTLVLADTQTAGRGRNGHRWTSGQERGVWLTLIERPTDRAALDVLALRVGLHAAEALQPFSDVEIRLKWPNDLYVGDAKLAGVLIETRWREDRAEWVAIGVGVNVVPPTDLPAGGLRLGTTRAAVLVPFVRALRVAARYTGPLSTFELDAFAQRDLARGRACTAPAEGIVQGIAADGTLLIEQGGVITPYRAGSLLLT